MASKSVQFYGKVSEGRAVKIVWVDEKIVFVCLAEMNERGHSRGLPTLKLAGPDDRSIFDLVYSFQSFAPEISEGEFNSVAQAVSEAIISFSSELPILEGLSQANINLS